MEKNTEELQQVIRNFDESMCTKASKSWVSELVSDVQTNFISKADLADIDKQFNHVVGQIEETRVKFTSNFEKMKESQMKELKESGDKFVLKRLA